MYEVFIPDTGNGLFFHSFDAAREFANHWHSFTIYLHCSLGCFKLIESF